MLVGKFVRDNLQLLTKKYFTENYKLKQSDIHAQIQPNLLKIISDLRTEDGERQNNSMLYANASI